MTEQLIETTDLAQIEAFLRRDAALHIYELGDLDPFYRPHTRWFALTDAAGTIDALALLYTGARTPTVLALSRSHDPLLAELLTRLRARLPSPLYAHLGPGLRAAFEPAWSVEHHGHHLKLVLADPSRLDDVDVGALEWLDRSHLDELHDLYARSYPGNWFDPRMLDTGHYVGIREQHALRCVAGVHVYGPGHGVAALGNVTTDPAFRRRGLARRAVAGLCRRLRRSCPTIGLNVHADNHAAITCYEALGFELLTGYDEYALTLSSTSPG